MSTIAQWLGVHLGSADSSELSTRAKKEQSASERFQQFSDVKTSAWHAARHVQAQLFLPTRTLTLTTCRRSSSSQPFPEPQS